MDHFRAYFSFFKALNRSKMSVLYLKWTINAIYIDNLSIYIEFRVHFWYKTDIFCLILIIVIVSTDYHLPFWSSIGGNPLYRLNDMDNFLIFG